MGVLVVNCQERAPPTAEARGPKILQLSHCVHVHKKLDIHTLPAPQETYHYVTLTVTFTRIL